MIRHWWNRLRGFKYYWMCPQDECDFDIMTDHEPTLQMMRLRHGLKHNEQERKV